jgi:subtilisin family serine protease
MQLVKIVALTAGLYSLNIARAGEFFPSTGDPVPNQFIVVLDHDPGERLETLRIEVSEFLSNNRIAVTSVWNSAINGFVASGVGDIAAREIAALPGVAFVEPDIWGRADAVQPNAPAGLDLIDQRTLQYSGTYTYNYAASNVHAYILDSGFRTTHVDFGGRATNDVDFTNEPQGGDLLSGDGGHGTGVASVVGGATYGVAKQIHLHSVRVISLDASSIASRVVSGLNWVNQNKISPAVVNMSLQLTGSSNAVDNAITGVVNGGAFVSVAAGNKFGWSVTWPDSFADACTISPARAESAFSAAAPAGYSYRGSCVDIFAPSGVTVASSSTDTAVKIGTGTSFSSPHVAGAAALILQQYPSSSPVQVRWELVARSTKNIMSSFFDSNNFVSLYNSPNRWLYSLSLGYTSIPPMPVSIAPDLPCNGLFPVAWQGAVVNSTNLSTHYKFQYSSNASYSPATTIITDGTTSSGYTHFHASSDQYVRVAACNTIGCSSYRAAFVNYISGCGS